MLDITLERAALQPALATVRPATGRGDTIPVYGAILIDAQPAALTLTATDGERTIVHRATPAGLGVAGVGTALVPADRLIAAVGVVPAGADIRLSTDSAFDDGSTDILLVASGRARWRIPCLPAADAPPVKTAVNSGDGPAVTGEVPGNALADALDAVRHAHCRELARYYLCGAHLVRDGAGALRVEATDGHRLARQPVDAPDFDWPADGRDPAYSLDAGVIVATPAAEALAALARGAGTVALAIGLDRVALEVTGRDSATTFATQLVAGTWPDVDRVMPDDPPRVLTVDRAALAAAAKRVTPFGARDKGGADVTLESDGDGSLTVRASDGAAVAEDVVGDVAEGWSGAAPEGAGPAATIHLSARYLADTLDSIAGETVTLRFDPGAAGATLVMTPVLVGGELDPAGAARIVMPRRK